MGFDERHLHPAGVVTVSGWRVKQYRVTVAEGPVEEPVLVAAERFLPKLLPAVARQLELSQVMAGITVGSAEENNATLEVLSRV